MAVVYRYVDLHDEKIKYVGIVWSGNRTLEQRVKEHSKQDEWCVNGCWRVEYLQKEVKSRIDAELLEAHYISQFKTNEWYNTSKANWGTSELLQNDAEEVWREYTTIGDIKPSTMTDKIEEGYISVEYYNNALVLYFNDKNEISFNLGINVDFNFLWKLKENSNLGISGYRLLKICLLEMDIDNEVDENIDVDEVCINLIRGKIYHFTNSIEKKISEVDGHVFEVRIGQIVITEEGLIFDSIKHIANSPAHYIVAIDDTKEYDNLQISDIEKAHGITSTNQESSAEKE